MINKKWKEWVESVIKINEDGIGIKKPYNSHIPAFNLLANAFDFLMNDQKVETLFNNLTTKEKEFLLAHPFMRTFLKVDQKDKESFEKIRKALILISERNGHIKNSEWNNAPYKDILNFSFNVVFLFLKNNFNFDIYHDLKNMELKRK